MCLRFCSTTQRYVEVSTRILATGIQREAHGFDEFVGPQAIHPFVATELAIFP